MNIRTLSTITLSVAFAVLVITGILLYAIPFNYFVSSMHIWGAILFLLCIIFHLKNNAKTYKSHLRKRQGKWSLVASSVGAIPIIIGLIFAIPPIVSVVEFSRFLKGSDPSSHGEYAVIDLTANQSSPRMHVFFKAGSAYESEPQPLFLNITYTSVPQIVVWMETLEGSYIDTLYVSGKSANSSFNSKDPNIDTIRRPEALPYWGHKRGIQAEDGLFTPDNNSPDLDGISSATPKNDYQITVSAPKLGRYKLMIEVNRSYDFNEYYSPTRFPEDPTYSGSGSSGQPSLIYQTIIESQSSEQHLFELVGHGHHSGADGVLYSDVSNITTAKNLLEFIVVTLE